MEMVHAVEGRAGFLSDLAIDGQEGRRRVLDGSSAQSVAVDHHTNLFGQIHQLERSVGHTTTNAQVGELNVVHVGAEAESRTAKR